MSWLNGQANGYEKSKELAGVHTRATTRSNGNGKAIVIHNPTSGGGADTIQSGLGKIWPSNLAREVAQLLSYRAGNHIESHLYFHSQGGIMGTNALILLTGYGWAEAKVEHHGSASQFFAAYFATKLAGAEWVGTRTDPRDLVGNVVGMNTANPVKVIASLLWAPSLAFSPDNPGNAQGNGANSTPWWLSHHSWYNPTISDQNWVDTFKRFLWE